MKLQLLPVGVDRVRFECTKCGKCCTHAPGTIWSVRVTRGDIARLSSFLHLDTNNFIGEYVVDGGLIARDGRCTFLTDDNLCSVHDSRPEQCRTFPFWPENVISQETWDYAARACEGMNRLGASEYTKQEIQTMLNLDPNPVPILPLPAQQVPGVVPVVEEDLLGDADLPLNLVDTPDDDPGVPSEE